MYDYIENLKRQRFTAVDRKQEGITAHKIHAIGEKEVTIEVPPILSKTGNITFPMSDTSSLQIGDFLDFRFSYIAYHGKVNDYRCQYLGKTPPQFIPKEGD